MNIFDLGLERGPSSPGSGTASNASSRAFSLAGRNEDYVSKNFERWKELATQTSKEQDPAKLTELATEMNLVLNQKPTAPRSSAARAIVGVARREPTRSESKRWR